MPEILKLTIKRETVLCCHFLMSILNLGMLPELSSFSVSSIWWGKIRLGENKTMKLEVTTLELKEEL